MKRGRDYEVRRMKLKSELGKRRYEWNEKGMERGRGERNVEKEIVK